jgi:hypothetical protein
MNSSAQAEHTSALIENICDTVQKIQMEELWLKLKFMASKNT